MMAQGITITLTRQIERRLPYQDEGRYRIWAGTYWCWLDSKPRVRDPSEPVKHKPAVISSTIQFPPASARRRHGQVHRSCLLQKLREEGVHLLGRKEISEIKGDAVDEITARILGELSWQMGEKVISWRHRLGYFDETGRFVELKG